MAEIVLREWTLEPYDGDQAPRHIHHRGDEAFYVLDGRLEVLDGERRIALGPGEFHIVEAGTVHTFATVGSEPVRVLVVMTREIDALVSALHSGRADLSALWAEHHSSLA
jgi:mannose-6-phosphate isomerase-like protein (cupin superfamily)